MRHTDFIILARFGKTLCPHFRIYKESLCFVLQGLEIKLSDSKSSTTVQQLATAVVETAGHDFTTSGLGFGIELGRSSVYYHVSRGDIESWVTDDSSTTSSEFEQLVSVGIERGKSIENVQQSVCLHDELTTVNF